MNIDMEDFYVDTDCSNCWYCDNLIEYDGQIGLLYLGFPRVFVRVQRYDEFFHSSFEEFLQNSDINWLDPSDKGTDIEQTEVLTKLWNFAILQEEEENNRFEMDL